jgi:hypothetical protein
MKNDFVEANCWGSLRSPPTYGVGYLGNLMFEKLSRGLMGVPMLMMVICASQYQ